VYFRSAANTRARKARTAFAHNSRRRSAWAAGLYAAGRARGKRNRHATRILARAWLRVIRACVAHRHPYHPTRRAAGRHAARIRSPAASGHAAAARCGGQPSAARNSARRAGRGSPVKGGRRPSGSDA
jgi:hypothetical protein